MDCKDPKNAEEPQCLAGADLTNIQYKKAVEVFQKAEKASGVEQIKLYEESASLLVQAVQDEPNHPQAPLALEKAAIALERTSRFESAARLYARIIDEVGKRKAKDVAEQENFDTILANAYFRLAFNANRFFDYDRAIENYRILADSERFKKSTDKDMPERRAGRAHQRREDLRVPAAVSQGSRVLRARCGATQGPEREARGLLPRR